MKELYYVTSNQGKFDEVSGYLAQHAPDITLIQHDCAMTEIQSIDQVAVAHDKARQAWQQLGKPLLVDDAGIYFHRYHEFPGVFSKFVMQGIGMEGFKRLIEPGDIATFRLALVYCDEQGVLHTFQGECEGKLVIPERYQAHYDLPYDDIFVPHGLSSDLGNCTYAQLRSTSLFSQYAYRLRAVQKFLTWLQSTRGGN